MINKEVKKYIDLSVLCWLATVSPEGIPNVSPKEIFTYDNDHHLMIAHIASPTSAKNIHHNKNVCVSFIDVLVQKGFKIFGQAMIINKDYPQYQEKVETLKEMAGNKFPIQAIIYIEITKIKPILAPSYLFYPETSEKDQVAAAMKAYKML